jgi:hypothetical protein
VIHQKWAVPLPGSFYHRNVTKRAKSVRPPGPTLSDDPALATDSTLCYRPLCELCQKHGHRHDHEQALRLLLSLVPFRNLYPKLHLNFREEYTQYVPTVPGQPPFTRHLGSPAGIRGRAARPFRRFKNGSLVASA